MGNRRGHGDGSIYQRSDGRWVGEVHLGWEDEKRRRKFVYARTRREAADKMREVQRLVAAGLPVSSDRLTVGDWLSTWLTLHLSKDLSPNTVEQYRSIVEKHLTPAFGRTRLKALTPADVEAMLRRKAESGLSSSTCMRIRSVLQMALHRAQVEGHVHRNVAELARRPRVTHEERKSLTTDEAKRLLSAVQGTSMEAPLTVMLLHGLRPGEAMGLTWDDIDFDDRVLRVRRSLKREPAGLRLGGVKTAKSERPLAMPGPVVKALRRRRVQQAEELLRAGVGSPPDNLVFTTTAGTPVDPSNLRRALARATKAAKLGHWKPYELRHSCTSLLSAAGVPLEQIADILGHRGIRMAAEVYRHRVDPVIDSGVEAMEALFGDGAS
ncbi:MAG: site-specific integrase [Acidimicrobiales bacterium]|nr:site-specific integrase [Acidimicrobiales bacterium]